MERRQWIEQQHQWRRLVQLDAAQHRRTEERLEREALDRQATGGQAFDREALDHRNPRQGGDINFQPILAGAQASREEGGRPQTRCPQIDDAAQQQPSAAERRRRNLERRWELRRGPRRQGLSGAILELQPRQPRIEPAAGVEAGVGAFLDDPAIVHDHDAVGSADRR